MPRIAWENNILGFIPRTDWLDVPFQITRPGDPVDVLFGDQKTDNLVAEWESIATEYQIPVMAQFHGFDTESQTTFRVPIDTHNIEKGLIKVKINQSERMRALTRAGVQNNAMFDYVINDDKKGLLVSVGGEQYEKKNVQKQNCCRSSSDDVRSTLTEPGVCPV